MTRRTILLLILIALGVLAWWLSSNRGSSSLAAPMSDFMIPDTSKVDRIFIAEHDGKSVDLRRQSDGTWTANSVYLAARTTSAPTCCWKSQELVAAAFHSL